VNFGPKQRSPEAAEKLKTPRAARPGREEIAKIRGEKGDLQNLCEMGFSGGGGGWQRVPERACRLNHGQAVILIKTIHILFTSLPLPPCQRLESRNRCKLRQEKI
jgi:hypothetical protein